MFSFGIIAENFEVFENYIFDCKVWWMVGKGSFCELCSAMSRLISWARCLPVVTAESG